MIDSFNFADLSIQTVFMKLIQVCIDKGYPLPKQKPKTIINSFDRILS